MVKYKEAKLDLETKEVIYVEYTAEELATRQKEEAEIAAQRLAAEQAEAEKQAKLESAKAKLTALGLDESEVQAILGL